MKRYYLVSIMILFVVIVVFSGCDKKSEALPTISADIPQSTGNTVNTWDGVVDDSFLTGEPCESPCWQNLEIGKSLDAQAMIVLNGLPFIDKQSVYSEQDMYDPDVVSLNYDCQYDTEGENCGFIAIKNGVVSGIGHKIVYDHPIKAVIDTYGEPSYIYYQLYSGEDSNSCQLALYWTTKDIAVEIYANENETNLCSDMKNGEKLDGSLQIDWVYYVELDPDGGDYTHDFPGLK
ncbi:MAG: hypothetical protein JXA19_07325 [Anaerolineales bacterium]|nr:hypothetical protein [Anaerolineales bacterium]